jgi:hypothetical protein
MPVCKWATQEWFDRPALLLADEGLKCHHQRHSHREETDDQQEERHQAVGVQARIILAGEIHGQTRQQIDHIGEDNREDHHRE